MTFVSDKQSFKSIIETIVLTCQHLIINMINSLQISLFQAIQILYRMQLMIAFQFIICKLKTLDAQKWWNWHREIDPLRIIYWACWGRWSKSSHYDDHWQKFKGNRWLDIIDYWWDPAAVVPFVARERADLYWTKKEKLSAECRQWTAVYWAQITLNYTEGNPFPSNLVRISIYADHWKA